MPNQADQCFDNRVFQRFLDEKSEAQEEARILAHIGSCKKCQAVLENLAGQENVWGDIQEHLAEHNIGAASDETHDHEIRDQQRDLKKVQDLLAPTDDPNMLGRLGGYEVCGVIGRGSAGIVVKALDTRLNRFVAIKLLAPAYSNLGCSRRRFEREARAIASVKDPHVVPIHTVDEFQGTPYIVMQYMPDGSLDRRIHKHGPLDTAEVVCIGMQVAKGLAAAHARGIVHRDVKPANVLLENGVSGAMVTDFGLARVVDEATMTRSGSISGTPQFMSPEQAKGERVDPRSDLFSLGSVMYTACTGHAPFKSESVFGTIKRVCESKPVPIREMNPDIDEWLEAFINRLQSKRPENRFESADDVAEMLSLELAHLQSPTLVGCPDRSWWEKPKSKFDFGSAKRNAILAGLLAVAMGLSVLAWNGFGSGLFERITTAPSFPPTAPMLLVSTQEENEKLEKYTNSIEATIDVRSGGELFFRSNLGTLRVSTHDKPTVEMKMTHTVRASDKETAAKLFKAIKLDYDPNSESVGDTKLKKQRDAVIIAKFPTKKLTPQEIDESDDLEQLKDALLIRNNSHSSNAEFELLVPKEFNLDLQTSAGPVVAKNIDGWAKIVTHGGRIEVGNVTGHVNLETHGGNIRCGDLSGDADLVSHGGHIEVGDVAGELTTITHGGHIDAELVGGIVTAETHGGHIQLRHTQGMVTAKTHGGGIEIWKAEKQVSAEAAAGKVRVNFVGQPEGDSNLSSKAGSVTVGYLEGLNFDIEASCNLGRVSAPFAKKNSNKLDFQLNDGQHKLVVRADTGSVKFQVVEVNEIDEQWKSEVESERGQRAFDVAYDLHMDGKLDEAIEAHKYAASFASHKGIATYNLGCAWTLKGDKDKAFAALNDAITFGFKDKNQFNTDDDLDSLRKDERFTELMRRLDGDSDYEPGDINETDEPCCDTCD